MFKTALAVVLLFAVPQETVRWSKDNPEADQFPVDGRNTMSLSSDGLTVWVSLSVESLGTSQKSYFKNCARIGIINNTSRRVAFYPETFALEMTAPKTVSLKYVDPDRLAGRIKAWAELSGATGKIGASMQTETHVITGKTPATITSPNIQARQAAEERARQMSADAENTAASLTTIALRANTLRPREDKSGLVIFDYDKHAQSLILIVRIESKVFEFPFSRIKKK